MEQLQTIRIEIEDCGEFARCEIPAYGPMYGMSVQDIKETLDLLEEADDDKRSEFIRNIKFSLTKMQCFRCNLFYDGRSCINSKTRKKIRKNHSNRMYQGETGR